MDIWPAHKALLTIIDTCNEEGVTQTSMSVELLKDLWNEHQSTIEASRNVAVRMREVREPGRLEIAAMILAQGNTPTSWALQAADELISEHEKTNGIQKQL